MTELSKKTWPEAHELFDAQLVVIQPIGSTEPHGPHLPLDTDVTIALAQSRAAVRMLEQEGVRACILPPLPYGLTRFTDGFAGWISLRPGTLWAILEDVIESLSDQGVRRLVFSNGHLEPEHVQVLRGVAVDFSERSDRALQVVFPDNTRRQWAQTLSAEFQSGDCHAGSYETGIVMAADPDSVREEQRAALPPVALDLIEKMRAGADSFIQAGAAQAYCGDPAAANAEEGQQQVEALGKMIVESLRSAWPELFA